MKAVTLVKTISDDQKQDGWQKYAVKRIVQHYSEGAGRRLKVSCYDFGPEKDTLELASNVPQYLVA